MTPFRSIRALLAAAAFLAAGSASAVNIGTLDTTTPLTSSLVNVPSANTFSFEFSVSELIPQFSLTFTPGNGNGVTFSAISLVQLVQNGGAPVSVFSGGPLASGATLFTSNGPFASGSNFALAVAAAPPGNGTSKFQLTVAAVPEPHEWAMMLAGLGVVGWAAARRRRSDETTAMPVAA